MSPSRLRSFVLCALLLLSAALCTSGTVSPLIRGIEQHVPRYANPLPPSHSFPVSSPSSASTMADDCLLRQMTLDAVSFLATADTTGDWRTAAYWALQLQRCNASQSSSQQPAATTSPSTRTARQMLDDLYPRHNTHPLPASPSSTPSTECGWEVFVDAVQGKDDNLGSIDAPLSSVHQALARSRRVARPTPSSPTSLAAPANAVCITVRAGTYYFGYNASASKVSYDSRVGALALTPLDSGLTLRAFPNESVVFSGGVPLDGLQWSKAHNQVVSSPLPALPAFDRWHFNELYVAAPDGGSLRAVRAKYPNGNPETSGLWTNSAWEKSAASWAPIRPYPAAAEIHVQTPQRPNTHFPQYQMGVGGAALPFNPPESFWALKNPPGGGGSTFIIPSGVVPQAALAARMANWSQPETGLVFAFHDGHWGSWAFDIAGIDGASRTLRFGRGGFQEARGSRGGAEFYVAGILEELDDALEYFVDYDAAVLYFQPNGSAPEGVVASQLPCILSIQGEPSNPVDNVIVSGITFTHTASTFMRDYEVPSGGDWSVHRGGAVFLENTRFTSVLQNTFTRLGGNAVVVSDYNQGVSLMWNEFAWLGESAVVLLGSVDGIDGTRGTSPLYTNVIGNLIREVGTYIKQTAGVVQFLSSASFIAQNAIFNVPRAGVNINDGHYGGTHIANNVMFNTVRETSDHGPINSWDRIPYLVDYGLGPTLTPLTNVITRNLLMNNYVSVWPIDHDDGSAYYLDSYNVLVYGGYKNYLGHSKTAHHHLYIFPDGDRYDDLPAFAQEARTAAEGGLDLHAKYGGRVAAGWGQNCAQFFAPQVNDSGWDEYFYNNTCYMQQSGEVLSVDNCDLKSANINPHAYNNTYYFPRNVSFSISCSGAQLSLFQWQTAGYDRSSVQGAAPPLADIIGRAKQMLGMSSTADDMDTFS